ncbi:hypothetical protein [Pseudomonas sp. RIT-PI-S]|uniref:hypothetical protein n=1 Tax=Pseudomonas sp. RIT-PI-S TaxID=3035295 RepID=UPI0021DB520F|nr:hypothetical protein [Pseudomonas sp. RIT-PI-S]
MSETPLHEAPAEEAVAAPEAELPNLPWAEVAPEHYELLRLAAQPSDRTTGPRPLRFVQFGWAERHGERYSLLRLNIELPGQRVRKEQNCLDLWADHLEQRVWSVPETLSIEPPNRGLGRFLLAQAASWATARWPAYRIDGVELPNRDALVEDTRQRRDHVLRTHGLDVEYADAQHLKGRYKDTRVSALLPSWNAEKLQRVNTLDSATLLQLADKSLQELEVKLRKHEERINKYRREDGGLRFTIGCLIAFAVFQAALLIWIATHR